MSRKMMVAGNWKMNTSQTEALELTEQIHQYCNSKIPACDVVICAPYIYLALLNEKFSNRKFFIGAQNCADELKGAFTGEISVSMLTSSSISHVIIGHSERRSIYGETDKTINKKNKLAISNGLHAIFCVGETLEERESNKVEEVIQHQLMEGLKDISEQELSSVTIAYEPVWAIGTGKTASPEQAQEVHAFIRKRIQEMYSVNAAEKVSILYGGSCNAGNAATLFAQADIDGGLIGGASLKFDDFSKIIEAAF